MTTERIVEAAATMLETWAVSLRASETLCLDAIARGDPDGLGIGFLRGKASAYADVAEALLASADHARGTKEQPRLKVVE